MAVFLKSNEVACFFFTELVGGRPRGGYDARPSERIATSPLRVPYPRSRAVENVEIRGGGHRLEYASTATKRVYAWFPGPRGG